MENENFNSWVEDIDQTFGDQRGQPSQDSGQNFKPATSMYNTNLEDSNGNNVHIFNVKVNHENTNGHLSDHVIGTGENEIPKVQVSAKIVGTELCNNSMILKEPNIEDFGNSDNLLMDLDHLENSSAYAYRGDHDFRKFQESSFQNQIPNQVHSNGHFAGNGENIWNLNGEETYHHEELNPDQGLEFNFNGEKEPYQQELSEEDQINFLKAQIVSHPLYEELLEAHVACLKVGTPLDQLPLLDLQLERADLVAGKYMSFLKENVHKVNKMEHDPDELTNFLAQFIVLLRSFKKQLEDHVKVHAKTAVIACWELEQSFVSITGTKPGAGSGLTMSDDEQSEEEELSLGDLEGRDTGSGATGGNLGPYGPLVPTDSERSIMERMREELKQELKNGYRDKISDVREEIMRKRRAGKLPGDTTAVLKAWWNAHSKWPYPTEEEKALLVSQTGLELKQINNWFINQRKRNWHSGPSGQLGGKNMKRKQM